MMKTGEELGKVFDVLHTPGNDVYWVKGNKEVLIPVLKDIVVSIDIDKRVIIIKPVKRMARMKIDILTLFPEMFEIFNYSMIGKAIEKNILDISSHNIRDYTLNKHKKVDDYPYGGGAGMVMLAQPLVDCIKDIKLHNSGKVIFLGPRGKTFTQEIAKQLCTGKRINICMWSL